MNEVQFEDEGLRDTVVVMRRRQSTGVITRFVIEHRFFSRVETVQYVMLAITVMCFIFSTIIVVSVL